MRALFRGKILELKQGDISLERTEAIVNSANSALAGGGAVDRAIRERGGVALIEEMARLGGCNTGFAVVSSPGNLPVEHVIHAVGPVWSGGDSNEAESLYQAYARSLGLARREGIRQIAFPAISTGIFCYPMDLAAPTALAAIADHLEGETGVDRVTMVLHGLDALEIHEAALQELAAGRGWELEAAETRAGS